MCASPLIPMIHGEGIVMRLLDKGAMEFSLGKLGMEPDLYAIFRELIQLPHGIYPRHRPTGSVNRPRCIAPCSRSGRRDQDHHHRRPVEYQLQGNSQIQVHPKIGLTFANSLRSILRHDPDIILVGEVRDLETAENAIQASLTGHLGSARCTRTTRRAYTRMSTWAWSRSWYPAPSKR